MATMNVIIEKEIFCEMELKRVEIHDDYVELFFESPKFDLRTSYKYYDENLEIYDVNKFYKSLLKGFATIDDGIIDTKEMNSICINAKYASNK
jgi:hypothetical protein